ncbi:MAG: GNAT family N-acetyltransferase [Chloroflexota bacterium]
MVVKTEVIVRNARLEDQQKLAYLVHFDAYVHRHLDYRPPLDWLGSRPFALAEENGKLIAALACPPDPPRVAWIRLFAAGYAASVEAAWQALWEESYAQLLDMPKVSWAAAIPLHPWFKQLLDQTGFVETHRIIMLAWEQQSLPPAEKPLPRLILRPMTLDDLPRVEQIDVASFVPVWQNSLACLEFAFRQAAIATVAELEDRLVGYQISTPTHLGGHLARLAVLPEMQGYGIGYSLVHDLLEQFVRRGARLVSVNTQKNNLASQALYYKFGFALTGEEYPIYQFDLHPGE